MKRRLAALSDELSYRGHYQAPVSAHFSFSEVTLLTFHPKDYKDHYHHLKSFPFKTTFSWRAKLILVTRGNIFRMYSWIMTLT